MMIYVVSNQKGGVGKSTTANAVGAWLHRSEKNVLYIDLDAQGNLSHSLKANGSLPGCMDVLTGKISAREAIKITSQGDIIPSSSSLAGADLMINETGKEYRLREALESVSDRYDYCIIDCPPALGTLTVNALTAADEVIIPVQADIYSLQAVGQVYSTIQTVKKYCNNKLNILGLVVTRYNSRSVLSKDMTEMLAETAGQLDTKVFDTCIRECVAIKEAQARQTDIFAYAPKSNGAIDYENLSKEIFGG